MELVELTRVWYRLVAEFSTNVHTAVNRLAVQVICVVLVTENDGAYWMYRYEAVSPVVMFSISEVCSESTWLVN